MKKENLKRVVGSEGELIRKIVREESLDVKVNGIVLKAYVEYKENEEGHDKDLEGTNYFGGGE